MSSSKALSWCHTIKPTSVKFYKHFVLDNIILLTLCFYLTIFKPINKSICHLITISQEEDPCSLKMSQFAREELKTDIQTLSSMLFDHKDVSQAVVLPLSLSPPKSSKYKSFNAVRIPGQINPTNTIVAAGGPEANTFTLLTVCKPQF